MKKFTILAVSMALAVSSVAPAFAQVPPVPRVGASSAATGQVKASGYNQASTKKVSIKKTSVKKVVIRKPIKKAPVKAIPSANATSSSR